MFDTLSERLGAILDKLTRKGVLGEADVAEAMREVRRALLEADVALDVARDFTEKANSQAIGQAVVRSVTPGQMVIKIVHDQLAACWAPTPPRSILPHPRRWRSCWWACKARANDHHGRDRQAPRGSDKKESAHGLARHAPPRRARAAPCARRADRRLHPPHRRRPEPAAIAKRALEAAKLGGYDVLLLDTAGRTHSTKP